MIKRLSVFLLSSLLVLSCSVDSNRGIVLEELNFSTTDDSELFFVNVRQLYYDVEEMQEAKLKIYRNKKRVIDEKRPLVNPVIVWNWMYDEAYILLEFNSTFDDIDSFSLISTLKDGSKNEIKYTPGDKMQQLQFATQIYNEIKTGSEMTLVVNGQEYNFLSDSREREAFRITMADYYRMVNIL